MGERDSLHTVYMQPLVEVGGGGGALSIYLSLFCSLGLRTVCTHVTCLFVCLLIALQAYGGMRGIKGMVCETSVLDADEGIRFRGYR